MTTPRVPPEASDDDPATNPDAVDAPDADVIAAALIESGLGAAATPVASDDAGSPASDSLRQRLLQRAQRSRARHAALSTVRRHAVDTPDARRALHTRSGAARPGEPDRIELLTMHAGSRLNWRFDAPGADDAAVRVVEWLVLAGEVRIASELLVADDFYRHPVDPAGHLVEAVGDARLYVRIGTPVLPSPPESVVSRGAAAVWDGAPADLERRVLWVDDAEAAVLLRARAGVSVAPHRHRVDEECLVLSGEIFAGDVLVREGDFQLAPAGCIHSLVRAETDAIVYLRGDTDYEFVADPDAARAR